MVVYRKPLAVVVDLWRMTCSGCRRVPVPPRRPGTPARNAEKQNGSPPPPLDLEHGGVMRKHVRPNLKVKDKHAE